MTRLTTDTLTVPVAAIGPPNPLPQLDGRRDLHDEVRIEARLPADMADGIGYGHVRSILPYLLLDSYDRTPEPTGLRVAVLENGILRATFLLDYGGRLWTLTHLPSGRDLVYESPAIQPANLALRNAWFCGGVEWNIGTIGHSVHTCEPVHAARVVGPDGTPILRLYELERIRGTPWQVDAYLPDGSHALFIYVRIQNPNSETIPCYWWTNIAVAERPDVRVLAPASSAFHFSPSQVLRHVPSPAPWGIDISYATNSTSSADVFFDIPDARVPWIAALDGRGAGLVQTSTTRLRGRKHFMWGMHQGGRRWQESLSGASRPYMEIQAGITRTQLEHAPMPPGAHWSWVEVYAPLQVDPAIVHGPWPAAVEGTAREIETVTDAPDLEHVHRLLGRFADAPPASTLHLGSGWGALERARRRASGDDEGSPGLPFPDASLGQEQADWIGLLREGRFAAADPSVAPNSYMVDARWERLLEQAPGTWSSALRLGVSRFAAGDEAGARAAWERSFELAPNPWAARNIAILARRDSDLEMARDRLAAARALAPEDIRLTLEWIAVLLDGGDPDGALAAIEALEPRLRALGRVRLAEVRASLDTGDVDRAQAIFDIGFEVPDLREGEPTIEVLWYEVQAHLLARALGRSVDDEIRQLARRERPIPRVYDLSMEPASSG